MTNALPIRLPWPPDFPDVVIHTDVRTRDRHPGYAAAKAGDAEAALLLASDLLSPDGIVSLQEIIGNRPTLLLPVVADELTGFNAIPDAPMPDLLSTAVALHALTGMRADLSPIKESCLDFIDSLWVNKGSFYGNWSEETLDVEYTYYALLALGHLSL